MDPNSQSNVTEFQTRHIFWNIQKVDFSKSALHAVAEFSVEGLQENVKILIFDTKALNIQKAFQEGKEIKFEMGANHQVFGFPLKLHLATPLNKGQKTTVSVEYETTPESSAIQWLSAQQTSGKKHPYLFTQCQAIHARSMLPCQDAPAVKAPYSARVKVQAPLVALMSALSKSHETKDGYTTYEFEQPVPTSSYLIALVVGALESKEIGPRSKVFCEKETVDACATEFSETESFLSTAEMFVGKYVWGRYDALVLPPSFPYGGMENPCLTFLTPTLLSGGDRSNADVVLHEISHSWTGNLVSCADWSHFWLNEGWTVFLERKVLGKLHGEKYRHFHAIIGWKALQDSINEFGASNPLTALVPNLKDIDPDDAFSSVPYEKGFCLLFYLESLVGIENFEKFMKSYVEKFSYKTVDSNQFKELFLNFFSTFNELQEKLKGIEWNKWFFEPGMPVWTPKFDTTLVEMSKNTASLVLSCGENLPENFGKNFEGWRPGQIVVFLDELLNNDKIVPISVLKKMNQIFDWNHSKNCEIRFRWLKLCLKSCWEESFEHVVDMLKSQGRMKYTRPLYRFLYRANENGKKLARSTFEGARSSYHSICEKMVAKDLELTK